MTFQSLRTHLIGLLAVLVSLGCSANLPTGISDRAPTNAEISKGGDDGAGMIQAIGATFIGDAASLRDFVRLQGSNMSQFVGTNFVILPKPISTKDLADAIISMPAGQRQIEAAVRRAVSCHIGNEKPTSDDPDMDNCQREIGRGNLGGKTPAISHTRANRLSTSARVASIQKASWRSLMQ